MNALVTGIDGFVGPHLARHLKKTGYSVIGTYLSDLEQSESSYHMDVTDPAEVNSVIGEVKPDAIFHLAGFSSVSASFKDPDACMAINAGGTKNLLDGVIAAGIKPKVLVVSSAEVYGNPSKIPVTEKSPVQPMSPYAESRVKQEAICRDYVKDKKLHIVISRSFNHSGPDQKDAFVLPSFAKQIALIERGMQDSIQVGNLDVVRDFSDVRDVVVAYQLLLEMGKQGDVYNVCSGAGFSIKALLDKIVDMAGVTVAVEQDPSRLRPSDIPVLIGDNRKLKNKTGWKATHTIDSTLVDLLGEWRGKELDA
jgi:GDP-4-dehydro-6-deoxy-D-mannose reductase